MAAVKLYTAWWCGHCHRLKFQLRRAHIGYEEFNVEDHPEVSARIVAATGGNRIIPAVEVGETLLINPRVAEVEAALERKNAVSRN